MKNKTISLRALLCMLGCGAAILLLALLPAAVLAAGDTARFGKTYAVAGSYISMTPTKDDYYLLRTLRSRASAHSREFSSENKELYLAAGSSVSTMIRDDAMGAYADTLLAGMVADGALPEEWARGIDERVHAPSQDANAGAADLNGYTEAGYYYSSDTLGFITICGVAQSNRYEAWTVLRMVVESRTGQVVSLWINSDAELPLPDPAVALPAWLAETGLDELGDWAPPTGTSYENSGLWSARGEALALCASHTYTRQDGSTAWFLNMDLMPYEEQELR